MRRRAIGRQDVSIRRYTALVKRDQRNWGLGTGLAGALAGTGLARMAQLAWSVVGGLWHLNSGWPLDAEKMERCCRCDVLSLDWGIGPQIMLWSASWRQPMDDFLLFVTTNVWFVRDVGFAYVCA